MKKKYLYTGPINKEKNVKVDRKLISRVFNQPIIIGQGSAKLRKGSKNGEILEEFKYDSKKVFASGSELVLCPEKQFPYETEIFLTLDDGFVMSKKTGQKCDFLNEYSEITFSFTTENPIGKSLDGGIVIAKNNERYLIISPEKSQLNLLWEERSKSITYTEKITGTTGWFVPSSELFLNEKLNIKNLWFKPDNNNNFWTDDGYEIDMDNLILRKINKSTTNKVRTFKYLEV